MSADWIKPGVTAWHLWCTSEPPREVVLTEKVRRVMWKYMDKYGGSIANRNEIYPTWESAQAARLHAVEGRIAEQEKTLARERALRDKIKAELEGKR